MNCKSVENSNYSPINSQIRAHQRALRAKKRELFKTSRSSAPRSILMATGSLAGNVSLSASSRSSSICASAAAGALCVFLSVSTTCSILFNLHFDSLHNTSPGETKGGNLKERGCDRVSPMTEIEFIDGALRVDAAILALSLPSFKPGCAGERSRACVAK
jgi:hypothetical protein